MTTRSAYIAAGKEEDVTGIATRVAQISVSVIKQMPVLSSGVPGCVSLGQGIPSPATPEFIRREIADALMRDPSIGKYSHPPDGLVELKRLVAGRLRDRFGAGEVSAESEVFISAGAMESLSAVISTIVERGDEVILATPSYSSHIEQVLFAEGVPVFVPLDEENGWALYPELVRANITSRTKAILLCSPGNPTGGVIPEATIREIVAIAEERGLFVIADEAYEFLTYDGERFFSLAALKRSNDRLIVIHSFSKVYCMTGWRVGYTYASARIIDQVLKVHDAFAICAPTISQYAAIAALRGTNGSDGPGDRSIAELVSLFERRRARVAERLRQLPTLFSFSEPRGSYFVFPKILIPGKGSMELALELLHRAKVVTIPGAGFGPTGEGHLRFSFGASDEVIEEAFDRIDRWARESGY